MTVAKLLTSRDAPLTQMELLLWATYHRAQERLRQQQQPRRAPDR